MMGVEEVDQGGGENVTSLENRRLDFPRPRRSRHSPRGLGTTRANGAGGVGSGVHSWSPHGMRTWLVPKLGGWRPKV